MVAPGQALFAVNDVANLVMVGALALDRVIDRFNDAIGHPHSNYRQRVPQAAHKQHMPCIPNPFKMKWKHYLPPLTVQRFRRFTVQGYFDIEPSDRLAFRLVFCIVHQ